MRTADSKYNIKSIIWSLEDGEAVLRIFNREERLEHVCRKEGDIADLRGYFFYDEIEDVIKKTEGKEGFEEILGYLKKHQRDMFHRGPKG